MPTGDTTERSDNVWTRHTINRSRTLHMIYGDDDTYLDLVTEHSLGDAKEQSGSHKAAESHRKLHGSVRNMLCVVSSSIILCRGNCVQFAFSITELLRRDDCYSVILVLRSLCPRRSGKKTAEALSRQI